MMKRISICIALVALMLLSAAARADTSDSTMGQLVSDILAAANASGFSQASPMVADSLGWYGHRILECGAGALTIEEAVGLVRQLDWRGRMHWRQDDYRVDARVTAPADSIAAWLRGLRRAVNVPGIGLDDHLVATWGDPAAAAFLVPFMELHDEILKTSMEVSLEKIRRYEVKFGPGSPHLNLLETGLNYALQWWSWFGPDDQGWPGPWEAMAGYETTFLTYTNEEPRAMAVAQFGLRRYIFRRGWGEPGWSGMLKPRYWSAAFLVAGNHDGALTWPWRGEERYGAAFSWGAIQVGYLWGDDDRFIVSREFYVIPGIF
jgi:hypothetical protein